MPWATTRPPFVGGAGAEVDDVVGRLHHLQVVLDDDQRMAHGQQRVEAIEQLHDVRKVQAGGRLVEDEQRSAAARGRHVGGQLQPLGLAARERVGRLAEPQVVEPHVDQPLQPGLHLGLAAEERERLADGHLQHVGDVAAAILTSRISLR